MNKFFDFLFKALFDNWFTKFFEFVGFEESTSKGLSGALSVLLAWMAFLGFKKLKNRYVDVKTARKLVHFRYGYKDVEQKRALFIPSQFQNYSPAGEEEPGFSRKFVAKEPLIDFFIKTAFNEKKNSDKFYLVLADSGMGKTTFMINLYLRYHSLFNIRRKYKMKLFPFGDKSIVDLVKEIKPEEVSETILLLDAFDEYKALLPPEEPDGLSGDERFRKVLDEIIENVRGFREVVITSRSQYFPGQEEEPYALKIPRYGSAGFHTLGKLYLSPFEDKEIKRYLNKKYKCWNRKKKRIAVSVVKKSPRLMARPMLLSYIDYLSKDNREFDSAYQIYEVLVEKWIEREASKRKPELKDRKKFKKDLYEFSRLAALEIYNKQEHENVISEKEAKAICNDNDIDLRDYEITGQSLLTRDASHNWKFAHKSILEYFLAKEAVQDIDFWARLARSNFTGMEMARLFYEEEGVWVFVNEKFESLYQVYEALIEKWIEQEAEKLRRDSKERKKFESALRAFSRLAALEIYNRQKRDNLLSKEEAESICRDNNINLSDYEGAEQSLLVRDVSGNWKFAHKYILEYFLAKECHDNMRFASGFNFAGLDMANHFYMEMIPVFDERNFVKVEGGAFLMGSADDDKEAESYEKPRHQVKISDFYISKTPVTQKQWRDFMGTDPEELKFRGRDNCPVENVGWHDVQSFIKRLSEETGKTFRLPTEAEWEFAARGGNKSKGYKFSGGDKLDDVAWYDGTSDSKTRPVKTKAPNELGLYDMSGNVWEWCQDKWHDNYKAAPTDGSAWESGDSSYRVVRGGSWRSGERFCRVADRRYYRPGIRDAYIGFRLVLVP